MRLSSISPALLRPIAAKRFLSVAVLPLLSSVVTAQIHSVYHYSQLIDVSDDVSYSSNDPFEFASYLFEPSFATPLPKFDPSLGTLLEIKISFSLETFIDLELAGSMILDDRQPHGASFDTDSYPPQLGLYYVPPSELILFNLSSMEQGYGLFFFLEDSSSDADSWTSDGYSFDWSDTVVVYDPANGIFTDYLDDYVGPGTIVGLRPGLSMPTTGTFQLDNVEQADAYASATVYGWIEVEYVYQIPEATHFGVIAALAALGLVVHRRRLTR